MTPVRSARRFAARPLVALALAAGLCAPALAQDAGQPLQRRPTLSVTGEGSASAVPDMATFSTGVVSEAKTAREALDANNAAVAATIAAIRAAGVEAKDVSTVGFSVQPQFANTKKDGVETSHIVGYEVRNTVSVRLRDFAGLGALLDQMVSAGANEVSSVQFGFAEPGKLEDAARTAAVKDARRRAEMIAEAAGLRIVRVVSLTESGGPMPPPMPMLAMRAMKADAVPVAAGESEVRASVSAVFEIEPR
ncbi:SIMPL domain-containing protein [Ancylobacter lacus]|uniref:SIMPL domain-containing protein n=1 Tax=Ancylobacter lacus TaxID=2579970 RepID=UPI001BD06DA7|nr:SIMPL domain-containing protein [Ancylobacter lacus]MBS7540023.1 SIMPL domain-containing protein [Ancylobacter lacus]